MAGAKTWVFYSKLEATLAGFVNTHLTTYLPSVIEHLRLPLLAGLTLYLICWGILMMTGRVDAPSRTAIGHCFKIGIVMSLVLSIGAYTQYVVELVLVHLPDFFTASLGLDPTNSPLDGLLSKSVAIGGRFLEKAGLTDLAYVFAGYTMLALGLVSTLFAFLVRSMCDFMLAVLLSVGPIFIALALFDATKPFFEKWTAFLLQFVLTKILLVLVLSLFVSLFDKYLSSVITSTADGVPDVDSEFFVMLVQTAVYALVLTYLVVQTPSFASSLSGGVALSVSHLAVAARSANAASHALPLRGAALLARTGANALPGARQVAGMLAPRNRISR